jgi:uncharacterized protein (DUF1810 family)
MFAARSFQRLAMPNIESWKIESIDEADAYLKDLLAKPEYRSLDEIQIRANQYIEDPDVKKYFITKGREILKGYGIDA